MLLLRVTFRYRPAVIEAGPITKRECFLLTYDLDATLHPQNPKVLAGNRSEDAVFIS
jgi:hypothetical protein